MRHYRIASGFRADQVEVLKSAGVPLQRLEEVKSTYFRLQRGSVLHSRDCLQLDGKDVAVEHHSLISIAQKSVHERCTRWRGEWNGALMTLAGRALMAAEIFVDTRDLKGRKTPVFALLQKLLTEIREVETIESFTLTYGDTKVHEELLKDLLLLQEEWSQTGTGERAAACVVRILTCPRPSVKLLGAKHDKAWRLARVGWDAWQGAISLEEPYIRAHQAAEKAIVAEAKRFRRGGEEVLPEEIAGIRALTRSWEKTLKSTCSADEGEVLLVNGKTYSYTGYGRNANPILAAAAAFPSARNPATGAVAVRCPTQVADWIHDGTGSWESRKVKVLGCATEKDTQAVLETLVAVWDPAGTGDAADPRKALQVARTIAG